MRDPELIGKADHRQRVVDRDPLHPVRAGVDDRHRAVIDGDERVTIARECELLRAEWKHER